MKVLVTGATGFLGGRLAARLVDDGVEVRALVRNRSRAADLARLGIELVEGSLHPAANLEAAVNGIDAIVHCAGGGRVHDVRSFYDNNLETTRHLLAATLAQNPSLRFVLVSSLAAGGPSDDGTAPDPYAAPRPVTHYGKSKAAAEDLVRAETARLHVTVVRPPAIYGPGDTRVLPLFQAAARGIVPLPGRTETTSVIHVDDCAEALARVALGKQTGGRVYYVDDGHPLSVREMVRLVGDAVGRRPRVFRVPLPLLSIIATVAEAVGRLRAAPTFLTRDKVLDLAQRHWICDSTPIRVELGWSARIGFGDGARETARWYSEHGWL